MEQIESEFLNMNICHEIGCGSYSIFECQLEMLKDRNPSKKEKFISTYIPQLYDINFPYDSKLKVEFEFEEKQFGKKKQWVVKTANGFYL